MKLIRPNCRAQFTPADYDFLGSVLPTSPRDEKSDRILRLRADEDSMDQMLDHPKLFRALLDLRSCLPVSMHFYFYVLVRHVLLKEEIQEREVADYVAEVLAEFALLNRLRSPNTDEPEPLDYLFDMIVALERLGEKDRFAMQTHIGNYALFLSGIFPNQLQYRVQRRGAPGFQFYENLGSSHFKLAGNHALARKLDMVSIYNTLGEAFHVTRLALNHLSERLVFLETDRAVRDLLLELDSPGNSPSHGS
jgi:hypothetical protein